MNIFVNTITEGKGTSWLWSSVGDAAAGPNRRWMGVRCSRVWWWGGMRRAVCDAAPRAVVRACTAAEKPLWVVPVCGVCGGVRKDMALGSARGARAKGASSHPTQRHRGKVQVVTTLRQSERESLYVNGTDLYKLKKCPKVCISKTQQ